jgi:hypothetical protein
MSASKILVRQTTREDIEDFCGTEVSPSVKAMTFEREDEIIGMGGVVKCGGRWLAFFRITDELRPHKMVVARAAIRFFENLRKQGVKFVYAQRDMNEPTSGRWLESLGFEMDPGMKLYRWRA